MFKICVALVMFSFSFNTYAANTAQTTNPACYASCNYYDQGSGSTFVGESKKDCNEACADGLKKCTKKATGECKKMKCLSNCPADQGRVAPSEMDALAHLEKLNPDLQSQVAGRCTKFWDVNLGKYEGVNCPTAIQEGFTWGLIGLLLGSLGSASTMTAATVGGFAFGFLNHSDY